MNETKQGLERKIASASDLHGIVRSMKVLAMSNIGQYEQAVGALDAYSGIVSSGLGACFRQLGSVRHALDQRIRAADNRYTFIVFGSDHGLVGPFNDRIAGFARLQTTGLPGRPHILAVGERVAPRLHDQGLDVVETYHVPLSVSSITALISDILLDIEAVRKIDVACELHALYNSPVHATAYKPVDHKILPLDMAQRSRWQDMAWPTNLPPEIIGSLVETTSALIREFIFVSLFKACALSLASENASRLAAMQRADKNIDELLEDLYRNYHHVRQQEIDDDLSDIIAGYEAQSTR